MSFQSDSSPLASRHSPLRTVLIGTSLEDESDNVVRAGLAVARAARARVYLVHAAAPEAPLVGYEPGLDLKLAQEDLAARDEQLRRQIARLGIGEEELAGREVLAGAPHRLLTEAAGQSGAGLIVLGATGAGPLAAELLGSTADRVLRKATCPVLVVRGELRLPPKRVLAPVDLSALSGDAFHCGLHLLAQLASGGEVEVRAVYALGFLDALQRRKEGQGERASFTDVERHIAGELERFVLENRPSGLPFEVETAVLSGEARFEILDELKAHPADLVVLGTHGRGGLDRLMLGSVAATIARKAPCSVLLVSPEASLAETIAEAVTDRMAPAWHQESPLA